MRSLFNVLCMNLLLVVLLLQVVREESLISAALGEAGSKSTTAKASKVSSPVPRYCVVESCEGCRLVRLKEVHKFISTDLLAYENTEFRSVPGKSPEMIFYSEAPPSSADSAVKQQEAELRQESRRRSLGKVLERLDLTQLDDRAALNGVLQQRGFRLRPEYRGSRGGAGGAGRRKEGDAVASRLMGAARRGEAEGEL